MTSEKQYIDLFDTNEELICANSCSLLNEPRRDAYNIFVSQGFPSRKVEEYKYTDVDSAFAPDYGVNVKRITFPLDAHSAFRCSVPNLGALLYFMQGDRFIPSSQASANQQSGVYIGSLCDYDKQNPGALKKYYNKICSWKTDSIVALNTMLSQDGLLIYVKKGVKVENTLQIVNLSCGAVEMMTNRRILIILEEGAEASLLVCDHNLDKHHFLTTQVQEIFMAADSRLNICNIEETHDDNTLFDNVFVHQFDNSILDYGSFTLKNGVTRRTGHFLFSGEGCEANIFGGVIGDAHQHIDNHLLIDHAKGNCHSNVLYKYVLDGESTGAFAGKVLVRKDAQKTDSQETNANLCVSPHARMYTQPMLEIYADDVKCNHGSTVGRMDEKALFYMSQRGIPEEEAHMLLQEAFLGDAIRKIKIEALRERLTYMVEQRFRHKIKGCGNCDLCNSKSN